MLLGTSAYEKVYSAAAGISVYIFCILLVLLNIYIWFFKSLLCSQQSAWGPIATALTECQITAMKRHLSPPHSTHSLVTTPISDILLNLPSPIVAPIICLCQWIPQGGAQHSWRHACTWPFHSDHMHYLHNHIRKQVQLVNSKCQVIKVLI